MVIILFSTSTYAQSTEQDCENARKIYLQQNPDVAKAGMNAWSHYISYGKREGRKWPNCENTVKDNTKIDNKTETTSSINKNCELNGTVIFSNAIKYNGQCIDNSANGWGSVELNNGDILSGSFKQNKLQDNFIKYYFSKNKTTCIGPNKGSALNGPCISIDDCFLVSFQNWDNGVYRGNSNDFFKIRPSDFSLNSKYCQANSGRNWINSRSYRIPNTNRILYTAYREYNKKGDNKYWITMVDLETNKVVFNYGSFDIPIRTHTDIKNNQPIFIGFGRNNTKAYYNIKGHDNDKNIYISLDLIQGTKASINELPLEITKRIKYQEIINKKEFENYISLKSITLKDSSYIKVFNNKLYQESCNKFSPIFGSGALLIHFDKNHDIIQKQVFENITIYDFAFDNFINRIALSYKSKDFTFLSYYSLSNFSKLSDIFVKKNLDFDKYSQQYQKSPGNVSFSNTGTYLIYERNGGGASIFLGNELYYGIDGELYGFNNNDNTVLSNASGVVRAFDLEHKRLMWQFEIGADKINTGFYEVNNDFVIIGSGDVANFYKFKMPEPIFSFVEFQKTPEYLDQFIEKQKNSKQVQKVKSDSNFEDLFYSYLGASLFDEIITGLSNMLNNKDSWPVYNAEKSGSNLSSNSSSYSASTQSKSSGNKSCQRCNIAFQKPYLRDRCKIEWKKESKPGFVLCKTCQGYGFTTTNIGCNCPDGIGWCYDKECPVSSCESGWIKCSH